MAWILGVGLLVLFCLLFPAFRKFALIAVAVIILVIVGFVANDKHQQQVAKSLIPISQVQLSGLALKHDYSSYSISGEIRNNSNSLLTDITATVKAYDCPENIINSSCTVIGEDDYVNLLTGTVPPNQVRAIDNAYVSFYNMPTVKGNFLWAYEITGTQGR